MKKDVINYIWTDKKRTIFGLPISFTRYFLTEDKFITRKGFLSIEEDELDLYRVIDKKLVLPFGQRMFGCGTIVMNVKDVDTPIKEVKSIKAPRDVLAQLDKYISPGWSWLRSWKQTSIHRTSAPPNPALCR